MEFSSCEIDLLPVLCRYNLTSKNASTGFNITFIAHTMIHKPSIAAWMLDPNMTCGDVAHNGKPFDFVLTSTMLHQLGRLYPIHSVPGLRKYWGELKKKLKSEHIPAVIVCQCG